MNPVNLAQAIPPKYRKAIYSVLATLVALEPIFNLVDPETESKALAVLVVLGFGVGFANVNPLPPPTPPVDDV